MDDAVNLEHTFRFRGDVVHADEFVDPRTGMELPVSVVFAINEDVSAD